jgi:hypothetical protein
MAKTVYSLKTKKIKDKGAGVAASILVFAVRFHF